jgi:DNA-binding response OmpR family regulator
MSAGETTDIDRRPTVHVLLADNDELFIRGPERVLKNQGWAVTTVTTERAAREALEKGWFHIAILDLRLDDDGNFDLTGLLLAKEQRYSPIPKIIYTAFVKHEQIAGQSFGEPLLLVSKEEDRSTLIEAVKTVLSRTPSNWNLQVAFAPATGLSFEFLAKTISTSSTENSELEVGDLIRRLFHHEERRITVERVLWRRGCRIAVEISIFAPVAGTDFFIVVLGPRDSIEDEVALFRMVGPKKPGVNSTYLDRSAITTHFGAIAYAISAPAGHRVTSLRAAYRTPKDFPGAVRGLFETTLPPWHHKDSAFRDEPVGKLYGRRLLGNISPDRLKNAVTTLAEESGRVNFKIRLEDSVLNLPGGMSIGAPLARLTSWPDGSKSWVANSPGRLSGDNVLADQSGGAWCTDFEEAGAAPVLANHVAIEAMIRFDWLECTEMTELLQMERWLTDGSKFRQVDPVGVDKGRRTALQAIRDIRQMAWDMSNFDVNAYQAGMYYEAISRVARFDRAQQKEVLTVSLHALLAAALIVEPEPAAAARGIEIDTDNRRVRVNGRPIALQNLQFKLLVCLYSRKPSLCPYEIIFREVYQEDYIHNGSERYRAQGVKLSKLMSGLCDAIGEDWIENVRGVGHRFRANPDQEL